MGLPPSDFIIQVWDVVNGSIAPDLLKEGYEVLLSHTDYVYLDCGEPGWVKPGGYWCEPFHEWFQMYGYINDIKKIWGSQTPRISRVVRLWRGVRELMNTPLILKCGL